MGYEIPIIPGVLEVLEQSQIFEFYFKDETTLIDHMTSDHLAIIAWKLLRIAYADGSKIARMLPGITQQDLDFLECKLPEISPAEVWIDGDPWDKFVGEEP